MSFGDLFHDVAHPSDLWSNAKDAVKGAWDDFTGTSQGKQANKTNIRLQQMANDANIALQKSQQDWEGMMSNTAIQRRQADLSAGGINPLLAVGQAADVPNVSPARVEAAHVNPLPSAASGISSAVAAYQTYGASKLLDAQARKTNAEAGVVEQFGGAQAKETLGLTVDTRNKISSEIENLASQTNLNMKKQTWTQIQNSIDSMSLEQKSALFQMAIENSKAAFDASTKQFKAQAAGQDTEWARVAAYIGQFFSNLNPFNSAGSAVSAGAGAVRSLGR